MDDVYRGYRIAVKQHNGWTARITHVRGTYIPLDARSTEREGPEVCLARARVLVDRYVAFLAENDLNGEPN